MPEETKCQKCGAEVIKNFSDFKEFSCRSQWGSATGFIQTTICERKVEIATLRAALSKAVEALKPFKDAADAFNTFKMADQGPVPDGNKVVAYYPFEDLIKLNLEVGDLRRASAVLASLSTLTAEKKESE